MKRFFEFVKMLPFDTIGCAELNQIEKESLIHKELTFITVLMSKALS